MNENIRTTRFSGAEWADQLKEIMVIGAGGISSWTILNLSRIGHDLTIIDPDTVDETNVTGGQMYRQTDIGKAKVYAVEEICRQFGCVNPIYTFQEYFDKETGMLPICICGLDNMAARKLVFESWLELVEELKNGDFKNKPESCLFIDGRLTIEMWEVFSISGADEEAIEKYRNDHLFDDSEANAVDCTTKQSTFGAMGISSFITGTLCNWLTNQKYGFDMREVPFYQRMHLPLMAQKHSNQVPEVVEKIVEVEKIMEVPQEMMITGIQEHYPGELEKLRNFHAVVGSLHGAALIPKKETHIYSKSEIKEEIWEKL